MSNLIITIEQAIASDLESLVALRTEAMRESLERIGRFDPQRARERFASTFEPQFTFHIVSSGHRIGFYVLKPGNDVLLLDHLYIMPNWQRRGVGAIVLEKAFSEADKLSLPIRVGALRESDSNRFYVRYGFELVETTEFDNYYVRKAKLANR